MLKTRQAPKPPNKACWKFHLKKGWVFSDENDGFPSFLGSIHNNDATSHALHLAWHKWSLGRPSARTVTVKEKKVTVIWETCAVAPLEKNRISAHCPPEIFGRISCCAVLESLASLKSQAMTKVKPQYLTISLYSG